MDNYEQMKYIYDSIGLLTDKLCPECKSLIIEDSHGTQWCSSDTCVWSNDERLQEIIEIMRRKDDREISDREEDNQ